MNDEPNTNPEPNEETVSQAAENLAEAVSDEVLQKRREVHDFVEAWYAKHFHGLGDRIELSLQNRFHAAKEELKAELHKLYHLL